MDPETRDDIHEFITRGRKHIIEECQIDVILYSKEENIITVEEYQEINSYVSTNFIPPMKFCSLIYLKNFQIMM